jgi:flagellar FliL protein
MAEKKVDNPLEDIEEEAAVEPKKKGKLLVIIVILVVLGAGGGGAWWFLKGKNPATPKTAAQKAAEDAKPPVYAQLDKELTTGLTRTDAEDHYLQVEIKMKVANEQVSEKISQRVPEIRSALILLMTSKSSEDLKTVEDKQRLASEMAGQINRIIHSTDPRVDGVLGVYFTTFILQ